MENVSEDVLEKMRFSQHNNTSPWYVYQNAAMDSSTLGHIKFMKCGIGCTFAHPPQAHPDTPQEINWMYRFIGTVDIITGAIDEYSWIEKHQSDYIAWRQDNANQGDKGL